MPVPEAAVYKNREKEKEILGRAELFLESEELYLEL